MRRIWHTHYTLPGFIALLTLLVYLPALRNEFVNWDDGPYVFANIHIRTFDAAFLRWAFLDFQVSNWHPLTWISHALDYALWGLDPLGHHLTSIVLHAVNTALVVLLARRLLEVAKERAAGFPTDRTVLIVAGVTGLLFGIHPVHVESVAWVAERKDLLCALFFLLSIMKYMDYAISRQAAVGGRQPEGGGKDEGGGKNFFTSRHYLLALAFFLLALMSKPMAVTLPAVLLILDWYPLSRILSRTTLRAACGEKFPFIVISAVSSIITVLAQRSGDTLSSLDVVPLSERLLVAARSLIAYLEKMLLPMDLVPLYPYPSGASLFTFEYASSFILAAGITAVCVMLAKKQKLWLSAWGYYVVTLLPVLGLVQVGNQAMADRYTYLPSLGPFLVAGLCAAGIAEKALAGKRAGLVAKGVNAAALVLVAGLSLLTMQQTAVWRNSPGLWTYVIEHAPRRIPLMYVNRGAAFQKTGMLDRAVADYETAIALDPSADRAYTSLSAVLDQMGQFGMAMEAIEQAVALNPSSSDAYRNRGILYDRMGRYEEAIADYTRAISLKPSSYETYNNRGLAFGKKGQLARAIDDYNEALRIHPRHFGAHVNRGVAYTLTGQWDRALEDFNSAILLDKNDPAGFYNRAMFYRRTGNNELAFADIQKACDLGNEKACGMLQPMQPERGPR